MILTLPNKIYISSANVDITIKKYRIESNMDSDILLKEFEFEDSRCKYYYDLMYKSIQFTFVAVVALAVCAFAKDTEQSDKCMILSLILPI